MVGRSIVADEHSLSFLEHLWAQPGYVCGLILGQRTEKRDYIVHFAPTPSFEDGRAAENSSSPASPSTVEDVKKIQDKHVTVHARNVARMLPGGMFVLGVFIIGPEGMSEAAVSKLKSLAIHAYSSTKTNPFNHSTINSNQIIFGYSTKTKKLICNTYNTNNLMASLEPVNFKLVPYTSKWIQIDCSWNLSSLGSLYVTNEEIYTLKKALKEMLKVAQDLLKYCDGTIDGRFVDGAIDLEALKTKQEEEAKNSEGTKDCDDSFLPNISKVTLFMRKNNSKDETFSVELKDSCSEMEFNGILCSRIFMNSHSTVEETIKAVKEDLLRSLSSKCQMHWETADDIQFPIKGEGVRTEGLGRRVGVALPSGVQLSEHLFPGESLEEAAHSLQEHLGFPVTQALLIDTFETSHQPAAEVKKSVKGSGLTPKKQSNFLLIVLLTSLFVLVLSIIGYQFTK